MTLLAEGIDPERWITVQGVPWTFEFRDQILAGDDPVSLYFQAVLNGTDAYRNLVFSCGCVITVSESGVVPKTVESIHLTDHSHQQQG
jgi:hypothetical protein